MSDHYIIALDQGHLRIYAERRAPDQLKPSLEQVEAVDFPNGKRAYFSNDTSPQGRFPGYGAGGEGARHPGQSIDERLPMKEEARTRSAKQLAEEVEHFLAAHPDATWDFAAGPEIHRAVLERISNQARQRLRRALPKDLVKHQPQDLLEQFAAADRG
jgi:hypothetical protein